jgi:hypothetical protein
MSLRESVQAALDAKPPESKDQAVADLALTYAENVDGGGDLSKLGPPLLAALEALHMSPRARTGKASTDDKPGTSPLDELRKRRARKSDPKDLDAAAT